MRIPVKVYLLSGNIEQGTLSYRKDGPEIIIKDKVFNQSTKDHLTYSILSDSVLVNNSGLSSDHRITLKSKTSTRKISTNRKNQYDLYPPSTRGWITQLSDSGKEVMFVVQDIISSHKKLMTILDLKNDEIIDCYLVNPYETDFLFMNTDWTSYNMIRDTGLENSGTSIIHQLLQGPPPSWNNLASILDGVTVPQLEIRETMGETMEQLVPASFPATTRKEIMAFLAWIQKEKVPEEDPLDFSSKTTFNAPIFSSLVFGHIQCLLEKTAPPEYIRIMAMAERGLLQLPRLPTTESIEQNKWEMAWYRLQELFPNPRSNVLELADKLNKNNTIWTSLPVSRSQALATRKAWRDRFTLVNYSLIIRGFIHNQRIGLNTIVYVGGAHKWPHKHLSWTARLGHPKDKPPFIQVMIMPPASTEQTIRASPNLSIIEWSTSCLNLDLFDKNRQTWKNRLTRIYNSIQSRRTLRQLEREFPTTTQGLVYVPTKAEAKVLDYISWQMYLSSLEKGGYENLLEMDNIQLLDILTKLRDREIVKIQYLLRIPGLTATCHIVEGPRQQTQSLVRSFLKHMPSTTAMIEEGGSKAYIISRVPDDSVYDLFANLPTKASEVDMKVRCLRIDAYAGYQNDLYSRLLKSDQTWDDDISGLLSQIRS
ncbi:MAG: hypothetical protein ACTSU3_11535 [Candidatus Thorarchaeota archaeon]